MEHHLTIKYTVFNDINELPESAQKTNERSCKGAGECLRSLFGF